MVKLSMEIFAEGLSAFRPLADIKSNRFEISSVRLFSGNMILNDNTLYVGRLCDFFKNGSRQVICVHNNDILILDTEELEEVLDHALDVLEYYMSWDNVMMELLTSGAMLQDFYDASEAMFENPCFLVDAGQHMLAITKKYGAGVVDGPWDQMLETGSMDLEFLVRLNEEYPEIQTKEGLSFLDTKLFAQPSYIYNFFFMGQWTSAAVLIQKMGEITAGQRDVFLLFCGYIRKWFESHIEEQQATIIDTLLGAAIQDSTADTRELCRKLRLVGWRRDDPLIFIKLDAPFEPFNINRHLCRTLMMHFQNTYAVINELSICMLCNLKKLSEAKLLSELSPILYTSKYYGTKSRVFTLEDSFFKNYKYVELASAYSGKEPGIVYGSENYVLPYVLSELRQTIVPDITHPDLKLLRDYDKTHHTELFHTLYVYLKNERSTLLAAKELGLHRNSFAYRMKRLGELLEADLEDPMVRLHMLISFELLKI